MLVPNVVNFNLRTTFQITCFCKKKVIQIKPIKFYFYQTNLITSQGMGFNLINEPFLHINFFKENKILSQAIMPWWTPFLIYPILTIVFSSFYSWFEKHTASFKMFYKAFFTPINLALPNLSSWTSTKTYLEAHFSVEKASPDTFSFLLYFFQHDVASEKVLHLVV